MTMRHSTITRHPFLTLVLFVPVLAAYTFTTACAGTETGNPAGPDYTHQIEPMGVATTTNQTGPATPAPPEIIVDGGPGSVMPATGTIYAWPLENNLPGVSALIRADGSFALDVPALSGDRVRLQVRAGGDDLSPPLDIVVAESGVGFTRFNTALPCLRTSPELALQLDVGREDAIVITNHCDETVTRTAARIREGSSGITLNDDGVTELAPGAQSTIRVRFDATDVSPPTCSSH
jgi:hypothetical protein